MCQRNALELKEMYTFIKEKYRNIPLPQLLHL